MSLPRVPSAIALLAVAFTAMLVLLPAAQAQQAKDIAITYKGKQFQPAQISAPANTPLRLHVKNLDAQPMEFESTSLRVEKVVTGNGEGTINVRPLAPGRYEFFDDFNDTSRGSLTVQ
jgi:cupredoxin-like protein